MKEKVVLAYSGGLDTTAIIPWLKENFDYEVICVCGNCGQAEELDGLEERALSSGASKLYIEENNIQHSDGDCKRDFMHFLKQIRLAFMQKVE